MDAQPDLAGEWTTSHLSFHDDPSITFTIRYRPVLKAIESIFKNPELASQSSLQAVESLFRQFKEEPDLLRNVDSEVVACVAGA